jgi:hypothetical protein
MVVACGVVIVRSFVVFGLVGWLVLFVCCCLVLFVVVLALAVLVNWWILCIGVCSCWLVLFG